LEAQLVAQYEVQAAIAEKGAAMRRRRGGMPMVVDIVGAVFSPFCADDGAERSRNVEAADLCASLQLTKACAENPAKGLRGPARVRVLSRDSTFGAASRRRVWARSSISWATPSVSIRSPVLKQEDSRRYGFLPKAQPEPELL
jgi:hypothetical protein